MSWREEWKFLVVMIVGFAVCFWLPIGVPRFDAAVLEGLHLVKWYAQEHVLLCLVPAFFIAGAIGVFVSQSSVIRYLGPQANKVLAYGVASVSGAILAVCSCTILPLFAGIYKMGAGLGPASAFLYSGPAINVLAIVITARILGPEIGVARAVGAVTMSILIGLSMAFIFRTEVKEDVGATMILADESPKRSLWQNVIFFALMIGILVFANFGAPTSDNTHGLWVTLFAWKWTLTAICAAGLGAVLVAWFDLAWWKVAAVAAPTAVLAWLFPNDVLLPFTAAVLAFSLVTSTESGECGDWFASSWRFAKQIVPLLLFGVFVAGLCLGRIGAGGGEGLIPPAWIADLVGGNSLRANLFASVAGALMYFATLTEVPIVQGLIASGMGKGPALTLLLAGPALSLPSILVINSVLGVKKTAAFVALVVFFSFVGGTLFGMFV
ncbi:MAG: permease [Thermoguttaceae bacterium]